MRRTITSLLLFLSALQMVAQDNYITTTTYLDSTGNTSRALRSVVWFDGMGRERLRSLTTGGAGYATMTDYDRRGNVSRKWLPVPSDGTFLSAAAFGSAATGFYGSGETCFTLLEYEASRANRQTAEFGPGKSWAGHGTKVSYRRNELSGKYSCSIIRIDSETGAMSVDGVYPPGTLRVTESVNPDGMSTITFENRTGKTVLERRTGGDVTADTRYVYDRRGDLRYAISPEGCRLIPQSGKLPDAIADGFSQSLTYDLWHRVISVKLPGCGATQYVYDKFGKVILSSTATQRGKSQWTITKYDSRLRPAVQGHVTLRGASRESLQNRYADTTFTVRFDVPATEIDFYMGYLDLSGPAIDDYIMAWYYDDYNFIADRRAEDIRARFVSGVPATGLLTGTCQRTDYGDREITAFRYDEKGRETFRLTWDLWLNSRVLATATEYDFTGKPVSIKETWQSVSEELITESHTAVRNMEYDGFGRLTRERLSVDGGEPVTVTRNTYDEIGRLVKEESNVAVAYGYDIRSNLTAISSPLYTGGAVFATSESPDKSYVYVNSTADSWAGDEELHYSYRYDPLGRLGSSVSSDSKMDETYETDLNAAVTAVTRLYAGVTIQDAVKNFSGPKVTEVHDVSTPWYPEAAGRILPGDYSLSYDADGRLLSDGTRAVKSITYNPYVDRPKKITFDNTDYIQALYDPDGTLRSRHSSIRKMQPVTTVNAAGDTVTTLKATYINDYHSYNGNFETWNSAIRYHTPTGYYDLATGRFYQYIRNRQGSVMAVADDRGKCVQRTGYYPSGTPYILQADYFSKVLSPELTLETPRIADVAVSKEPLYATALKPTLTPATDRLHIGNIWLSAGGLNFYDNTARLHDPVLCDFSSPDPQAPFAYKHQTLPTHARV